MVQPKLFMPINIGGMTLQHRVVMAPLARFRADPQRIPTEIMVEYYAQRASTPGTFIIAEATSIAPHACSYPGTPEIFTDEQVAGWKRVSTLTVMHGYDD